MGHPRGSRVVEGEHRRVTLIRDLDQRRRRVRFFPRLGDDHRDVLAVMQHGVALERRQGLRTDRVSHSPSGWRMRQRGRIEVRDDGQHARCALGGVHRDVTDSPARHRALHQNGVGEAGKVHVDRIGGGTHHLEPPVDAIQRGADDINGGCCAHRFASLAVANARTMVRFASSILKWLCSRATAPANAISAASRNASSVALRPVRICSASIARHGLVAIAAQPQPRCSNGVAVEIEDDGR